MAGSTEGGSVGSGGKAGAPRRSPQQEIKTPNPQPCAIQLCCRQPLRQTALPPNQAPRRDGRKGGEGRRGAGSRGGPAGRLRRRAALWERQMSGGGGKGGRGVCALKGGTGDTTPGKTRHSPGGPPGRRGSLPALLPEARPPSAVPLPRCSRDPRRLGGEGRQRQQPGPGRSLKEMP